MTQEQKNKEFARITGEMLELYSSKNELYGDSFNQLMHELGLIAGVVPLDNKLRRIKSIVKGTKVKFESLEDSLYDLANYAILMLIHLKELDTTKTEIVTGSLGDVVTLPYQPIPGGSVVYEPCSNCLANGSSHSIINPCDSCPHNKISYKVTCDTKGGTNER